jgi:hypothetical protein
MRNSAIVMNYATATTSLSRSNRKTLLCFGMRKHAHCVKLVFSSEGKL